MNRLRSLIPKLLVSAAAMLAILSVACSENDDPTEPPVASEVHLEWVDASVAETPDGFEYTFLWSGSADVEGAVSYRLRVDRLLPDVKVSEVALPTSPDTSAVLLEPDDLEADALLLLTVEASLGGVEAEPVELVYGRGQIGPRARVVLPEFEGGRGEIHLPSSLAWDGYDSGEVTANSPAVPSGFECKVVDLIDPSASDEETIRAVEIGRNLLLPDEESAEWKVYGSGEREALHRSSPTQFAIAVRARDDEGLSEAALEVGRNVVVCTVATWGDSVPVFDTGYERIVGVPDPVRFLELPEGVPLRLDWDRPLYTRYLIGEGPEGSRVLADWAWRAGLDEPLDLEVTPNTDVLVLEVRFDPNRPETESLFEFRYRVFSVVPNGFLILDDHANYVWGDYWVDQHDRNVLGARFAELGEVELNNPPSDDVAPDGVKLEFLAGKEAVLWHLERYYESTIGKSETAVRRYLRNGGRLFLVGGRIGGTLSGLFRYPTYPPGTPNSSWDEQSLLWQELGVRDALVSIRTGASNIEIEASGLVGVKSVVAEFPSFEIDPTKWDPFDVVDTAFRGGIRQWEGLWNEDGLESPVEPLYTPVTFDTTHVYGPRTARYDDAVIAYRYVVPPEEGTTFREGRVVVFDFETFPFEEDGVAAAARAAIDWLLAP